MGIPFAMGVQMNYDGQLNYVRGGLDCYLRVNNFAPSGDFIEVGVPYAPSGDAAIATGFVDILILPPPGTVAASFHDIGMSGGKLMFGARKFFVSATFVNMILDTYPNIKGAYNVFRNWDSPDGTGQTTGTAYVQGIVYNNQLYSIEDIGRREIAGQTINFIITANAHEEYIEPASQVILQP
jgi:hypothetical protein